MGIETLQFGVEIEVHSLDPFQAKTEYRSVEKLGWTVKSDASIVPLGTEFATPIFQWEDRGCLFTFIDKLQRLSLIEGLSWNHRRVGCNKSCGLHIHLSGLFPNWPTIAEIVEKEWYPRNKNGFRPSRNRRLKQCSEHLTGDKRCIVHFIDSTWDRVHLELRLFNAHLSKRWIARCLHVAREFGELLQERRMSQTQFKVAELKKNPNMGCYPF